jgi:hypothetical protein
VVVEGNADAGLVRKHFLDESVKMTDTGTIAREIPTRTLEHILSSAQRGQRR